MKTKNPCSKCCQLQHFTERATFGQRYSDTVSAMGCYAGAGKEERGCPRRALSKDNCSSMGLMEYRERPSTLTLFIWSWSFSRPPWHRTHQYIALAL